MAATITVIPRTDAAPCPRVEVLVDDLDAGVESLTLFRLAEGRTQRVRGAINVPVSEGYQTVDVEAGFQTTMQYRAELFDEDGVRLGFTETAEAELAVDTSWVHNPLDPWGAVEIDVADTSGRALSRPVNGDRYYPEQRVLAMFITGRRLGLQGVQMFFSTDQLTVVEKFERMLGDYTTQAVPVLCVRTPPFMSIPRTFFAGVLNPLQRPITAHMGGALTEWDYIVDEAAPPFPGIIVPLLTRDDADAAFASRDEQDAAYPSRIALDRDFSLAGGA